MAVRTIEFEVSANGITPATLQAAGVQGDHKSTKVIFNVETELYQSITQQATEQSGTAIYRIDGYDAEGGVSRSVAQNLTQNNIEYYLEEWLTRYGGNVKIVLVISILKNNTTEMELFSFPALLKLKNLPDGKDTSGENYESMSTLSQTAKDAADTAVQAAADAEEAKEQTELARAALEGDSIFIFDGNGTFGEIDPLFVVDDTLSASSNNAIANSAVTQKFEELETESANNFAAVNQQLDDINTEIDAIPKTVDQTYNAESANAQSGTAVAQGISQYTEPLVSNKFPSNNSFSHYMQSWNYLTAVPWYTENMSSIAFLNACPEHCSFTVTINEHTFSDFPHSGTFYGILHVMCGSANYRMMTAYQAGGGNIYFCAKIIEQSSVVWKKITLSSAT